MKDLLKYILENLVDNPEDLKIEQVSGEQKTILIIHANQKDIGKIIGRGGRIIQALRDLVKIVAAKRNIFVDVEIAEEGTVADKS